MELDRRREAAGLAGHGYASQILIDARHVDAQLRAATDKGADLLHSDGEVDAAHRVLVAAIDNSWSRPDHDVPGLLQALHTLSVACYFGGRAELWVPFRQALNLLGDGVPPLLRLIGQTSSDPVAAAVAFAGAVEVGQHVTRLRSVEADPAQAVHVAIAAHVIDRLPDCRNTLRQVFLDAGDKNAGDWAVRAGLLLAVDAVDEGQWDEAETLADDCIGLCEKSGQRLWAWFGRWVLALVAAGRGQWNHSLALTSEVVQWATPRGVLRLISAQAAGADADHVRFPAVPGRGSHEDGLSGAGTVPGPAAVTMAAATMAAATMADPPGPGSRLSLVEAAVSTRQRAATMAQAPASAAVGTAPLSPRHALQAATAEALVAPDEQAAELFQAALDIPGIERWPFEVARVQLAFGARLRRLRAPRASREQLTAALDTFHLLGAQPWAERASAELRATGQTRRRTGRGSPAPLTPQELGIAELAATGLTNKQIGARLYLSPRTVSAHLYRVFPKLGITSRAALRDALLALPSCR